MTEAAHEAGRGCRQPVPSPPCALRTSGCVGQGQGRPGAASGILLGPGAWTWAVFPPLDSFSPFGVTSLAAPPSFTRETGILRKQHPGDSRALTLPEARGRAEGAGERPGGAGEPSAVGSRDLCRTPGVHCDQGRGQGAAGAPLCGRGRPRGHGHLGGWGRTQSASGRSRGPAAFVKTAFPGMLF